MSRFLKLYDEEIERLENISDLKVYKHLKFNYTAHNGNAVFDLQEKIAEDTGLSEKTIKRSIARLKQSGLIETYKKGRFNYYTLPILNNVENKPIETVIEEKQYVAPIELQKPVETAENKQAVVAVAFKDQSNEMGEKIFRIIINEPETLGRISVSRSFFDFKNRFYKTTDRLIKTYGCTMNDIEYAYNKAKKI